MILVINESGKAPENISSCNRALAAEISNNFVQIWQPAPDAERGFGIRLYRDEHSPRDVLLVDRFSEGCSLPSRGGVGHARKIGVDLAASLVHRKYVHSPWVHCTDGDVRLPETYFTIANDMQKNGPGHSALIYPFFHRNGQADLEQSEVELATQLYELSLRYYVAGLRLAGSPYAFHTIGSTMAVRASHYAKVRGFPRRAAGEDFYLLNKLAKVGPVLELEAGTDCEPLEIESRRSDRVPFGTGAAVNKITALSNSVQDFRFYDPVVFGLLKQWLQAWPEIWRSGSADLEADVFANQADDSSSRDGFDWLKAGLISIGTEKALAHAFRQSGDLDQFKRQMRTWFDAFRTLKLIHFLRDQYVCSVSYAELEARPEFRQLLKRDTELRDFHDQLKQLMQTVK